MILAERRVTLKSRGQMETMRRAGRLVADVLDRLGEELRPGITTEDLDRVAAAMIREAGATPSFIGVMMGAGAPYRHTICVSIDDEVVHGIPGRRRIEAGQVVSIDAGAIVDGWHGDAARTFTVGRGAARGSPSWFRRRGAGWMPASPPRGREGSSATSPPQSRRWRWSVAMAC